MAYKMKGFPMMGVPQRGSTPKTKKKSTKGKSPSLKNLVVESGHTGKKVAARGPVNVAKGVKMQIKGRYERNYDLRNAPSDIAKGIKKGIKKVKSYFSN